MPALSATVISTIISGSIVAVGSLHKGVKYLYNRKRNRDVVDSFVYDVATNHLPHIYDAQRQMVGGLNEILRQVGSEEKVELPDPPPVQFIDFAKFDHKNEEHS